MIFIIIFFKFVRPTGESQSHNVTTLDLVQSENHDMLCVIMHSIIQNLTDDIAS